MRVGFPRRYDQGIRFRIFPVILLALAGVSCGRGSPEFPVIPPPTDPLSREVIGYGVVNAAFAQVSNEPGGGGSSGGYLRRGAMVRVLERRAPARAGSRENWVLVEGASRGWLPEAEDVIQIFDNEARARTASESKSR